VYEFDARGHQIRRRRHPLAITPHSNHDFGVTSIMLFFFLSPLLMDFGKFWGGVSVMESLCWQPDLGSRILVSERESKEPAFEVAVGQGYCCTSSIASKRAGGSSWIFWSWNRRSIRKYQPIPDLFATVSLAVRRATWWTLNSESLWRRDRESAVILRIDGDSSSRNIHDEPPALFEAIDEGAGSSPAHRHFERRLLGLSLTHQNPAAQVRLPAE